MQIIQSIRDKGAVLIIVVIAISLIGFILMDARSGTNGGGSTTTTVGKVNGDDIEITEFNKRVAQEENKKAQETGKQPSGAEVLAIREYFQ